MAHLTRPDLTLTMTVEPRLRQIADSIHAVLDDRKLKLDLRKVATALESEADKLWQYRKTEVEKLPTDATINHAVVRPLDLFRG